MAAPLHSHSQTGFRAQNASKTLPQQSGQNSAAASLWWQPDKLTGLLLEMGLEDGVRSCRRPPGGIDGARVSCAPTASTMLLLVEQDPSPRTNIIWVATWGFIGIVFLSALPCLEHAWHRKADSGVFQAHHVHVHMAFRLEGSGMMLRAALVCGQYALRSRTFCPFSHTGAA